MLVDVFDDLVTFSIYLVKILLVAVSTTLLTVFSGIAGGVAAFFSLGSKSLEIVGMRAKKIEVEIVNDTFAGG
ncbi:hypothetical protein CBR_g34003 [Chara braunii]|uniref:Uncharacterized protein n=1 Tax=Chara braunii TaxID=69332 RepID=A0A388LHX5_CHABU|nr:hypothetical protein CBR_g34003 [Chara braunii]|eukprot:GBG81822.1 hypothetical protein CBR_g34003 [Chara braunii]